MKNVLVPLDFSAASRNAAEYAASLSKYFKVGVTFINVVPPPVIIDDSVLAFVMTTQAEIIENNKELMNKEVEAFSEKHAVEIIGFVQEGFIEEIVDEMARENHSDVIVMGMKGKGQSNSVFGSTTVSIIRKSSFPVFVIPQKASFKRIDNITFASDFDAATKIECYTLLLELSNKFNSKLCILNVQKNDSSLSQEKIIGKMETSLVFSRLNHQFQAINERTVEDGISKFIEKNPTDILAMLAHRHNLFERMFGKAHTKEMSYQTKIPLLVLEGK